MALICGHSGAVLRYGELRDAADHVAERLAPMRRGLLMLLVGNDVASVIALLGAHRAGHAVLLLNRDLPDGAIEHFVAQYRPDQAVGPAAKLAKFGGDLKALVGDCHHLPLPRQAAAPNHELALLLATSGSLGNPKAVRLSQSNLAINGAQIRLALGIHGRDRTVTALPISFTYGLSVLTSHLAAGASIVIEGRSLLDPAMRSQAAALHVTNLPSVTFSLDILHRLGGHKALWPSLTDVTHSGSRLSEHAIDWLVRASRAGLRFHSMYGMTEATARISTLPPEEFPDAPESVGRPVEALAVSIGEDGAIGLRGPNVMMGYAATEADLVREDELGGVLDTGDLGRIEDGRIYVHGRTKRMAKLFGKRIGLEDVERRFARLGGVCAVSNDKHLSVFVENADLTDVNLAQIVTSLARDLGIPRDLIRVIALPQLPRASSGKILITELEMAQ